MLLAPPRRPSRRHPAPVLRDSPRLDITRKVVVRYASGKVIQGRTYELDPRLPRFRVFPVDVVSPRGIEVWLRELKAVFFVKGFGGETRSPADEAERAAGQRVRVEFQDGEVLVGTTPLCDRRHVGLFVVPADASSNNLRVFAVFDAVKTLSFD